MIISEKQIMKLIYIAKDSIPLAINADGHWDEWSKAVAYLLDDINNQQSEELKVVE